FGVERRRELGDVRSTECLGNLVERHKLDRRAQRVADCAADEAAAKDPFVRGRWLAADARRIGGRILHGSDRIATGAIRFAMLTGTRPALYARQRSRS